jgi:UDP-N-acetylmuramoyl-tripeptide--D-alanyl-D-alanine ligase
MEGYPLHRLLTAAGADPAVLEGPLRERQVTDITTDSRAVMPGDVFFALRGERFDGAAFVESAAKSGALISVVNGSTENRNAYASPVAVVENTMDALGKVAADYRSTFTGTVIGVTGTSGKTTVKEMLLTVLGKKFSVHGTKGNFNNQIGLPLSVFGLRPSHDCAVFELGMSAPGEIAALAAICKPSVGIITNVGPAHAEFFKSVDEIADAKLELLEALPADGVAIVNGDDPRLQGAGHKTSARMVRFSVSSPCEYRASNIVIDSEGCAQFMVNGVKIKLRVPGYHMIHNALAVFAAGCEMGVDPQMIADGLGSFDAPKNRMERFVKQGIMFINDSYNANPLSMSAAADVLQHTGGIRKIAALGDMRELGNMTESAHREIGKRFAEAGIDLLCLVGEQSRHYTEGAREVGMQENRIIRFETAEQAAGYLKSIVRSGDVLLVKGSRAMNMEIIVETLAGGR